MTADVVVAGTYEGEDKLRISEVFWPTDGSLKPGEVMKVPALEGHSRQVFDWGRPAGGKEAPDIGTKELLFFAKYNEQKVPEPIWHYGAGSQGVIWFSEKQSFRYMQVINPGGYVLQPYNSHPEGKAIGKAELREAVQSGLESRERSEDMKAIKDPMRRARAMASVYINGTAPRGDVEGLDFKEELVAIGPDAIPAIAEALSHAEPDEYIRPLADILNKIAYHMPSKKPEELAERTRQLKPVVEPLIQWMKTRKEACPYEVLYSLELAADPRAIELTRPFLKHDNESYRFRAIRALGAMKDEGSFDHLAELILASPDIGATGYNMSLMGALFSIELERARPVVEEFLKKPGNGGLRMHVPPAKP